MCPTGTNHRLDTASGSNIRSAFDVLDADRDGKISPSDLKTFYKGFSGGGAEEEDVIGSMMSVADSNKDGFVEYDEFETVLNERNGGGGGGESRWGAMEEAFRFMDRDGDGVVGEEDLRGYFNLAGFDATDEDIKAMIRLGGGDQNQGVSYDGFLKILAV
ncbi:Calcium-binding protein CP1 [Camellia lanceoleosa]|uniref:Calcium-binding protein CP1 n=1 Tax=Camellia lanceoleosa TaxID=1840588 RepID=A0ACC0GPV9_9ERIC|nr:Calcium-binding protein CP1 [Camellia lanceoleosa]